MNRIDLAGRAGIVTGGARHRPRRRRAPAAVGRRGRALWDLDRDALAGAERSLSVHGQVHVVPLMQPNNYGRIVNIASLAGKNGTPDFSAYGASKAAVIALTKALARELADTEIMVNAVCPSVADTDIVKTFTAQKVRWMVEQVPKKRFVHTSEIAAMVAWLCSEECSFSTGQLFDISGGRAVY
jgi:3-oxoacyl-[acyl-carrier protein] reductase